jgi:hypothetical protein
VLGGLESIGNTSIKRLTGLLAAANTFDRLNTANQSKSDFLHAVSSGSMAAIQTVSDVLSGGLRTSEPIVSVSDIMAGGLSQWANPIVSESDLMSSGISLAIPPITSVSDLVAVSISSSMDPMQTVSDAMGSGPPRLITPTESVSDHQWEGVPTPLDGNEAPNARVSSTSDALKNMKNSVSRARTGKERSKMVLGGIGVEFLGFDYAIPDGDDCDDGLPVSEVRDVRPKPRLLSQYQSPYYSNVTLVPIPSGGGELRSIEDDREELLQMIEQFGELVGIFRRFHILINQIEQRVELVVSLVNRILGRLNLETDSPDVLRINKALVTLDVADRFSQDLSLRVRMFGNQLSNESDERLFMAVAHQFKSLSREISMVSDLIGKIKSGSVDGLLKFSNQYSDSDLKLLVNQAKISEFESGLTQIGSVLSEVMSHVKHIENGGLPIFDEVKDFNRDFLRELKHSLLVTKSSINAQ